MKKIIAIAISLMCFGTFATDVVWTNTVNSTPSWLTAGNWTDSSGNPLAAAPVSGENVTITDLPAFPANNSGAEDNYQVWEQNINYTLKQSTFSIGSVAGDKLHTISFGTDGTESAYLHYNDAYTVTIGDPTAFLGLWRVNDIQVKVTTPATSTFTPVYNNFSFKHRPNMNSTDAAGTTVIESGFDAGAIEKSGSGTLQVKNTPPAQNVMYVNAGKIVLGSTLDIDTILDKAALHLDASVADSLVCETGADGYTSVKRWNDVRGTTGYYCAQYYNHQNPASHQIANSQAPFLDSAAKSPTGLTLVDFGARGSSYTSTGYYAGDYPGRVRTNCVLRISDGGNWQRFTNVREAFYSASAPNGATYTSILGDSNSYHYMYPDGDTYLFNAKYSAPSVRHGDLIVNNQKHAYNGFDASELKNLYTLGVGTYSDTTVGLLGSREFYKNGTGGSRIGEVVLFTNELTRAERQLVASYLDKKWRTGETAKSNVSAMRIASAATIEVPSGCTAYIGEVVAVDGVVNKSGAGTLVIGRISPASTKINVTAGAVKFEGVATSDSAIAADPYVHLDATVLSDSDVVKEGDVAYLNTWKDITYGEARQATAYTNRPTVVTSSIVGKKVVDFGTFCGKTTGSWMMFNYWDQSVAPYQQYAGFMVMRYKVGDNAAPHFGSSNGMAFYRDTYVGILSPFYKNSRTGAAWWRVNGITEDPFSSKVLNDTTSFHVLAFSSAYPVRLDAIAVCKGGQSNYSKFNFGGIEIGEVLFYNRPLTETEIYSTERYLMKKWQGVEQKQANEVGEIAVDSDESVDLTSDEDIKVTKVSGGNGEVVKDGEGAVKVMAMTLPTSIDVRGGSLEMPIKTATFIDDAKFHFDASKLDTMTYTVDANGNTNVSSWADVRANGVYAKADSDALSTQAPQLKMVETESGSGSYIPVMDFGAYSWKTNDYSEVNGSASMTINDASGALRVGAQEAIVIFMDAPGEHRASVFGDTKAHDFQRSWQAGKLLFADNTYKNVNVETLKASSIVRNSSSMMMDGVKANQNTIPAAGKFHYYDYICSNDGRNTISGWSTGGQIGAIARTYGKASANSTYWGYDYPIEWNERGGIRIAEQLAFKRILTAAEEDYIHKYMNAKWFGAENPGALVTNEISTINVENGATLKLNLADYMTLKATSLSGDGVIETEELELCDEINATIANGKATHLQVEGTVKLGEELTINLSVDKTAGRIGGADYTILEATSLDVPDGVVLNINLVTSGVKLQSAVARVVGNSIVVRVQKPGFIIIAR